MPEAFPSFNSQRHERRPGSPPPAPSLRTALRRSAAPPQPGSCCTVRTRRTPPPRTPGPLPAPPRPPLPSRSPPPPLPPQPRCKEGVWAGGPAGRQAAGDGRLCTRVPRAAKPRTAPAPANNRLRLQRSASYRRRRVAAGARGSLGNVVYTRPTPNGMPGVGGSQCRKALACPGTSCKGSFHRGPLSIYSGPLEKERDLRAAAAFWKRKAADLRLHVGTN
ncbi:protein enabled homolog [Phodopus roborovskii]|uniref:protein enabled homolog n=1 Tax=Phodopus roborovskii TaxID=109678 RepID=UPI0021E385F0|nr:protein enabled homolog [Phodopus roborovskii]